MNMCLNCDLSSLRSQGYHYFNDTALRKSELLIDDITDDLCKTISNLDEGPEYHNTVDDYLSWGFECLRFIKVLHPDDYEYAFDLFNNQPVKKHRKLCAMISDPSAFPPERKKENTSGIHIINNVHNHQVLQNINFEALQNSLSPDDFAEMRSIIEEYKENPQELKSELLSKMKSFGKDVLSNIIANIISGSFSV